MKSRHRSVFAKDIASFFSYRNNLTILDCTYGCGGHTEALRGRFSDAQFYAFDYDKNVQSSSYVSLFHENFANIFHFARKRSLRFDIVMLDLGVSEDQIFDNRFGLSFTNLDCSLNMCINGRGKLKDLIVKMSRYEIYNILHYIGQESYAAILADNIFHNRMKINTNADLISIIEKSVPFRRHRSAKSKVFSAFRTYINREIENLVSLLSSLSQVTNTNAEVVIFTFNSLEDRIVKNYMQSRYMNIRNEKTFEFCKLRTEYICERKIIAKKININDRTLHERSANVRFFTIC